MVTGEYRSSQAQTAYILADVRGARNTYGIYTGHWPSKTEKRYAHVLA